ncbi:hypothetical protein Peur_020783 [Populus x canadensis]
MQLRFSTQTHERARLPNLFHNYLVKVSPTKYPRGSEDLRFDSELKLSRDGTCPTLISRIFLVLQSIMT